MTYVATLLSKSDNLEFFNLFFTVIENKQWNLNPIRPQRNDNLTRYLYQYRTARTGDALDINFVIFIQGLNWRIVQRN